MKTNLVLSSLLAVLLIFTYFFQEKKDENADKPRYIASVYWNSKITHIKTDKFEAYKKGNNWISKKSGERLSYNSFRLIEKKLLELKIEKDLEGYLPENPKSIFKVEVNSIELKIGEMSLDGNSFYIGLGNKYFLATIDGESNSISLDDRDIESDKLRDLKNLLSSREDQLMENQLFRYYDFSHLEKVSLVTDNRAAYVLDFKSNLTIPGPIRGIEVHNGLKEKFLSLLTLLQIKEKVDFQKLSYFKKISTINVKTSKPQQIIVWDLWLKNEKSADVILVDSKNKLAFLMNGGSLKLFFLNEQDYWDKKVIPPEKFHHFSQLHFSVSQNKRNQLINVINKEPLYFESKERKVKQIEFQNLFQALLNLSGFDQADRVSQLSQSEEQQFLKMNLMKIKIFDLEILCLKKPGEVIFINLNEKFKSHFYRNVENINCELEGMLE
jgi:hypothetical protein